MYYIVYNLDPIWRGHNTRFDLTLNTGFIPCITFRITFRRLKRLESCLYLGNITFRRTETPDNDIIPVSLNGIVRASVKELHNFQRSSLT